MKKQIETKTLEALLPKVFSDSTPECSAPISKMSLHHTQTLAQYIDGTISDIEREQVRSHLSTCDACWERYVLAKEMLNPVVPVEQHIPEEATTPIMSKILTKLSSLLEWATVQTLQPAYRSTPPQPHRLSDIQGQKITKLFNDLTAEIFIEKIDNDSLKIEITVSGDIQKKDHLYITLKRKDLKFNTKKLNDDGYTYLDNLPFASYRFALDRNGEELGSFSFEIMDRGIYVGQDYKP